MSTNYLRRSQRESSKRASKRIKKIFESKRRLKKTSNDEESERAKDRAKMKEIFGDILDDDELDAEPMPPRILPGGIVLHSGSGVWMDLDDEEEQKNQPIDKRELSPSDFAEIFNDNVAWMQPPKIRQHSIPHRLYKNMISFPIAEDGQSKVNQKEMGINQNLGLLMVTFPSGKNKKKYVQSGTATVIGSDKQWLLTCAHLFINEAGIPELPTRLSFIRNATPNSFSFISEEDGVKIKSNKTKRQREQTEQKWKPNANSIFPCEGYQHKLGTLKNAFDTAPYDIALVRLPKPMEGATATISFVQLQSPHLPKYMKVVGYPRMELCDVFSGSDRAILARATLAKNEYLRKAAYLIQHLQRYQSNGTIVPVKKLDYFDFDFIYHDAYTKVGYSGAPICVANKDGSNYKGGIKIVGIHSRSDNGFYDNDVHHTSHIAGCMITMGVIKWLEKIMQEKVSKYYYSDKDPYFHSDHACDDLLQDALNDEDDHIKAIFDPDF